MSRTVRRRPRRRDRHECEALFHIRAGGAKILNLRHIPGDISPQALLAQGIVRVDRATKYGNPNGERSVMESPHRTRRRHGLQSAG